MIQSFLSQGPGPGSLCRRKRKNGGNSIPLWQQFLNCGSWDDNTDVTGVTWELVKNAHLWALSRPSESDALRVVLSICALRLWRHVKHLRSPAIQCVMTEQVTELRSAELNSNFTGICLQAVWTGRNYFTSLSLSSIPWQTRSSYDYGN